jgi:uncharacterized protein
MKNIITVVFTDLGNRKISIELDYSLSPRTFTAILDNLPVKTNINRWGDELYTDQTPIIVKEEENAKTEVNLLDVAYWPEGNALCLFYGPTPISKPGRILAYSPVNIVGRIIAINQQNSSGDILALIRDKTRVIIKQRE